MQPSRSLFEIARNMFKQAWDTQHQRALLERTGHDNRIREIDASIVQLLDRIVDASALSIVKAYESRIAALENEKVILREKIAFAGRPKKGFEESFRTALGFLANPVNLWRSEDIRDKKTVLKLTFAKQLSYTKREGFRTVLPTLPFEVIQRLKGERGGNFSPENTMARENESFSNALFETLSDWERALRAENIEDLEDVA